MVQDRTAALVRRIGSLSLLLDFVCTSPRALDVMERPAAMAAARGREAALSRPMDENEHNTEIPAHRAVAHPLLDSATRGELADSCSVCAAVRCCLRLTEG